MEPQKFEAIFMDYALGATTPEVAALIEAFQEKDADVRRHVAEWRGVTALARRAIPAQEFVNVPIFPRSRLQNALRSAQWRRTAVWGAALAACLMLGYFVGKRGFDRVEVPASSSGVPTALVAAPAAANVPVAAVNEFWSQSRLVAEAQRSAGQPVRSGSNAFGNLSVLLRQSGG
jgi:hypothetical protein